MRLTDEDIQRHKNNRYNVECIFGKVTMSDKGLIPNLIDTIEALQQENKQLRDTAKGSYTIVSVAQEKVKKYEEVLGKAKEALLKFRRVYGSIGAEAIAELIDEVMKG